MLKHIYIFSLALTLGLLLFDPHRTEAAPAGKGTAKKLIPCIELTQICRAYGTVKLYVAKDRFRMEQMPTGIVFTCCAPELKIYSINNRTKTYYASNSNNTAFTMQRAMLLEGIDLSKVKWKSVEKGEIEKLDAERLIDATLKAEDSTKPLQRGYENIGDELRARGFWVASKLPVSPALANKVAFLNASPQVGKIPLRFIHISPAVKKSIVLQTREVKQSSIDAALFLPPTGYRMTRSEFDSTVKESDILGALGEAPDGLEKKGMKEKKEKEAEKKTK